MLQGAVVGFGWGLIVLIQALFAAASGRRVHRCRIADLLLLMLFIGGGVIAILAVVQRPGLSRPHRVTRLARRRGSGSPALIRARPRLDHRPGDLLFTSWHLGLLAAGR